MAKEETKGAERPFKNYIPEETIDHVRAARSEVRKSVEAFLPPGFVEHQRAARKEMLLAARSVIDAALARIEERGSKA